MTEAFVFAQGLSSAVQNFVNNVSFLLEPKLASSSLSEKLVYIALLPVTKQSERIDVKGEHSQSFNQKPSNYDTQLFPQLTDL